MIGVPVGAQIAWLSCSSSGIPLLLTRIDPTINWAVTHGPLPAIGGGKAQPATTQGATCSTVGCPITVTRGFGAVGCALPPCEHNTTELTVSRNPGIRQVISSAPLLMLTLAGDSATLAAPLLRLMEDCDSSAEVAVFVAWMLLAITTFAGGLRSSI
jgi:hypothetical protein